MNPNLPENVIELEYLVINNFNGKNYVDTGIVGNQNTCISVKFRSNIDINNVIGARQDRQPGNYGINIGVYNSYMLMDYGSSRIYSSVKPLNNIVEVSQHINTFSLYNGASNANFNTAASTFTTSVPLTIGAINTPVEAVTGVNKDLTIYYCKIYSDTKTIVRNFIPVIYDGVVCFWDLVTSTPFYNTGPDKLLAGPVKTYTNKIQLIKPNEDSNIKFVDCIVSDGRQYIDTGYIPNFRTGIKTEFMFNDFGVGFNWTLFGSRGTNYTDRSFELYSWKNKWNLNYHTSNNTTKAIDYKYKDKWLKVYANKNIWQIDDLTFNLTAVTFTGARSLYLCATNEGVVSAYGAIKIRRTLIYDNDVLVRDFRPCIYNGKVGMLEEISGTFYSNQGTGEFGYEDFVADFNMPQIMSEDKVVQVLVKPASQPDGLEYLEYIENPGLQYIDTGFNDTNGVSVDIDLKINKVDENNAPAFGIR